LIGKYLSSDDQIFGSLWFTSLTDLRGTTHQSSLVATQLLKAISQLYVAFAVDMI